jgi:Kinesin motor domain
VVALQYASERSTVASDCLRLCRIQRDGSSPLMPPLDGSRDPRSLARFQYLPFFPADAVFSSQDSHERVFNETVKSKIEAGVLRGESSTIIAHGPTGSGKSTTMLDLFLRAVDLARTLKAEVRLRQGHLHRTPF